MGIILGSFVDHFGIILGSFWGHLGVIWGSPWGHLGNHFGIILGSSWGHLGVIFGSSWGHFASQPLSKRRIKRRIKKTNQKDKSERRIVGQTNEAPSRRAPCEPPVKRPVKSLAEILALCLVSAEQDTCCWFLWLLAGRCPLALFCCCCVGLASRSSPLCVVVVTLPGTPTN